MLIRPALGLQTARLKITPSCGARLAFMVAAFTETTTRGATAMKSVRSTVPRQQTALPSIIVERPTSTVRLSVGHVMSAPPRMIRSRADVRRNVTVHLPGTTSWSPIARATTLLLNGWGTVSV